MDKKTQSKLLKKPMTRREFLQFTGGSILVLFGLGNILALMSHVKKTVEPPKVVQSKANNSFGTRKFGV